MTVNSKMTALADEIRELSGTTTPKSIDAMTSDVGSANTEVASQAELIAQITTALEGKASNSGGTILPTLDNPAAASDILSGKEAIDGSGNKITGSIATKTSSNLTVNGATVTVPAGYYASQTTKSVTTATQATPSVSIDANGKITASATQTAGYVTAGTKSGTKQMTTKAATTYTPGTSSQTIASGTYLTGTQTIKGDANLKAENIASGISIFGVSGTHEGGTTEDLDAELTTQETLIAELSSILDSKASGSGSIETSTVTLTDSWPIRLMYQSPEGVFYDYYDESGFGEVEFPATFTVNKNSWVLVQTMEAAILTGASSLAMIDMGDSMFFLQLIKITESEATIDCQ